MSKVTLSAVEKCHANHIYSLVVLSISFVLMLDYQLFITFVNTHVFHISLSPYDMRRLVLVLTLVLFVGQLFFSQNARDTFFQCLSGIPKIIQLSLFMFFFVCIGESIFSIAPIQSIMVTCLYITMGVSVILLAGLFGQRKNFGKYALLLLIVISGVYAAISLYNYIEIRLIDHVSLNIDAFIRSVICPGFGNVRFLNQYISWILPFFALPVVLKNKNWIRVICFLVLVYWWFLGLGSGSRAFIVEWCVTAILILFLFRKQGIGFIVVNVIAMILGLIIVYCMFPVGVHVHSMTSDLMSSTALHRSFIHDHGRSLIWHQALEIFSKHSVFGVGPGLYPFYGIFIDATGMRVTANPHNFILQLLVETGLIGTILLIVPFFAGFCSFIKKAYKKFETIHGDKSLMVVLTASIVCAGIHSMVSAVMIVPLSQFMFMIVIAISIAVVKGTEYFQGSLIKIASWHKTLLRVIAIALGALFIITFSSVLLLLKAQGIYAQQCKRAPNPNYWEIGTFSYDYPKSFFCPKSYADAVELSKNGPFQVNQ